MAYTHSIYSKTRVADLDTQRHVTSRTYEAMCYEGRHALLEARGYSFDSMLEKKQRLVPLACYVKFINQQMPGAELRVDTIAYAEGEGVILWQQQVFAADDKPVCEILVRTRFDEDGAPLDILQSDPEDQEAHAALEKLLPIIAPFSGDCRQVESTLTALYSERNIFGEYSNGALWRFFEDGRWFFSEKLGLTLDTFVRLDTTAFFMGAVFHYYKPLRAGQSVYVFTWMERIEKIRGYMRQDAYVKNEIGELELVMSSREEQLIVQLSKARPRRAPQEYIDILGDYIEK